MIAIDFVDLVSSLKKNLRGRFLLKGSRDVFRLVLAWCELIGNFMLCEKVNMHLLLSVITVVLYGQLVVKLCKLLDTYQEKIHSYL